jgi:hypothetical protein
MDDKIKKIIEAYLKDKESSETKKSTYRNLSPYVEPLSQDMPNHPYYTEQEQTDVNLVHLDSPHGGKDPSDLANDYAKMYVFSPTEEWNNADWAGGGSNSQIQNMLAPYDNSFHNDYYQFPNTPQSLHDPLRGASVSDLNTQGSASIDNFLGDNSVRKLASSELDDFLKLSEDTLIHKSKKDLWQMMKDDKGNVYIKRLFESDVLKDE